MKVCLTGLKEFGYSQDLMRDFFQLLQSELPLKEKIVVQLLSDREGQMTTGVRNPDKMKILAGGRMLIDVLRTIAHEWVHEFQHQKMGLRDDESIQDIGGPEEDMASALSSVIIKRFQKEFPQYQQEIYGKVP